MTSVARSSRRPGGARGGGSRRSSSATRACGSARCSRRRSGGWWSSTSARCSCCSWPRSGARIHSRPRSSTRARSDNFRTLVEEPVYRDVALRTISMAPLVTVADAVLAFPIAYYMARIASPRDAEPPRRRGADAAVGELPRQGVRLADDPRRADGVINWAARRRSGSPAPGTRRRALARRSRTSGCRS